MKNSLRKIIKEEVNKTNNHVSEELIKLSDTFYENGFLVRMYLNKDTIILMDLKKRESSLSGSYVMGKIVDFADEHGLKIKLVASSNYGTPLDELVRFYQKFGFKVVGDYHNTTGKEMVREDTDYSKEKDKGLHGWFERQGGKGKSSGWVDCNTCRKDSKTGRKKCKPCGREEGEKRSKYPACRPTPGACGTKGKGKKWGKKSKKNEGFVVEKWSEEYKKSIDCNNPKGFSQKAHCQGRKKKNEQISEGLQYHLDHNIPLTENIYRYGSEAFFNLINETRELYNNDEIELSELDEQVVSSDIGKTDIYEGEVIYLDFPLTEGENKRVNSPKKSGGKNYVYVKGCLKDKSKIKKITYGSSMPDKLKDPDRRKAFSARHGCEGLSLKDKCTRKYWSCRKPRDFANINAWW